MSNCADVCLDMGYDCDENRFYSEVMRTAKKPHTCCECGRRIQVGERYEYASGKSDHMWQAKTCSECSEIRKAFVCGSWEFGRLWETIEDGMFGFWDTSGPIDCLAKLETLAARTLCRTRYAEWKEPIR